jgi:hypothetical protein
MAEEFDTRLKEWVGTVIEDAEVSMTPPESQRAGRGVGLYLLELLPSPMPSGNKRPPLQLVLRYLMTTWSDKPEDAHQMLVTLMFAAMDNKDFQVELETLPTAVWTAFGVPPRPSFVLRAPLRHERPEPQTKLVRHPMRVESSPIVGLHGLLLGPGDIPLSDCRIEIPALHVSTNTDYRGRFYFPAVPASGNKQLVVKAKGFELPVVSQQNYPDSRAPLVIHFSPLEV